MGVNGLWTVVSPCARPIKIETLNKKRLAVDASIWIYQFLKAVRDKEGHGLRNSHVVGFFRRICKLLYFGIKPVFVFDGGAPALKRQTIVARKSRREGRREDATRTAGKLLALQMHRLAEEEESKRKHREAAPAATAADNGDDEEPLPENLVYVEEIGMSKQERQKKQFRKKDQYHLPDLGTSLSEMGGPNDPRVMSLEELEEYARQFESGEDINVYDFSKIDFDSPFFVSLPASDRYNILNAARLRSRLRMGYSKEQLDTMFPDRMAFSRFQIERVRERNELTQRLMNINGMADAFGASGPGRIAGEKGREYVLVKNDGVEGGWALGVIGDKDKDRRNNPIDVDAIPSQDAVESENDSTSQDEDFEDIPVEGLNRLPKLPAAKRTMQGAEEGNSADILRRRETLYNTRRQQAQISSQVELEDGQDDDNSLFVAQDGDDAGRKKQVTRFHSAQTQDAFDNDEEDEDLIKAIAMSLQPSSPASSPEADDFEEVFNIESQDVRKSNSNPEITNASAAPSTKAGSRSRAPKSNPFEDSDEDGEMDLNTALADSRRLNSQSKLPSKPAQSAQQKQPTGDLAASGSNPLFDGPLPFEKLDLGTSLLGKKKVDKIEQESAGGFEKDLGNKKKKQSEPLPPWFSGDIDKDMEAQKAVEDEDRKRIRDEEELEEFAFESRPKLLRDQASEVIIVDGDDAETSVSKPDQAIFSPNEEEESELSKLAIQEKPEVMMEDVAVLARVSPPAALDTEGVKPPTSNNETTAQQDDSDKEISGWEDSDTESRVGKEASKQDAIPAGGVVDLSKERSSSPEFEDVELPKAPAPQLEDKAEHPETRSSSPVPYVSEDAGQEMGDEDIDGADFDDSDEELMIQLATEAEEHARFASTLNQKSKEENIAEYERELKALRSQQKKDRRDADEVTQVMITECQQLLQLFGLPYITAPMEAEAQCAELVALGLVDGIVTDDSDIFLFGGTRIYKNMFNQAKFVECYLSSDLEREFDLTRERMIRIAHLLGSDYTDGLAGVGPVTALEIISEFPYGLVDFKTWWTSVQQGIGGSREDDASSQWRRKFKRSQATKLFLSPIFPDPRVDQAYLKPEVDSDPQPFQWGIPDLDRLRAFLMATIGWSQERTDEVLVPVIKDINRRENEGTQSNITNFVTGNGVVGAGAFAPRKREQGKSRRMETALEKMAARAREKRKLGVNTDTHTAVANDVPTHADRAAQSDSSAEADGDDESYVANTKKSKRKADDGASSRKRNKRSK